MSGFFKGSTEADTMLAKKVDIRAAGLRAEKKFFGKRGIFAKAGHTKHLKTRSNPMKPHPDFQITESKIQGGGKSYGIYWYIDGVHSVGFSTPDEAYNNAIRHVQRHPEIYGKKNPITVVGNPSKKKLSTPEQHMLRIALDTVKHPMKALLGGPSVEEAKETLKRYGITFKENPPARINTTVAGVLYNRCLEIRAEKTSKTNLAGLYYHPFLARSKVCVLALDNGDILIHSQAGEKLWRLH